MSKELEAYDNLKRNCEEKCSNIYNCKNCEIGKNMLIINKSLKALKIIKERVVNIGLFLIDTLDEYNYCVCDRYKLTEEEYNLLEEILK